VDYTIVNDTANNDIANNIQFELYINLDDSYINQTEQNCTITTDLTNLPDKKILFSGI